MTGVQTCALPISIFAVDGGENNSYALLRIRGNTSSAVSDGRLTLATGYKAYQLGSGDGIGAIYFADDTGGDWASILCVADGQGGGSAGSPNDADDYPAKLVFNTTPDGAGTPVERMRIDASGAIVVGIPDAAINVNTGGMQVNTNATNKFALTVSNEEVADG